MKHENICDDIRYNCHQMRSCKPRIVDGPSLFPHSSICSGHVLTTEMLLQIRLHHGVLVEAMLYSYLLRHIRFTYDQSWRPHGPNIKVIKVSEIILFPEPVPVVMWMNIWR